MTEQTLNFIHQCYQESVENSKDIMGIITYLYDKLSEPKISICSQDIEQYDSFLEGLDSCIKIRYKTFDLTNLASDVIFVIMYIIIWLNTTRNMQIDIKLTARRKALESDLIKLLLKSSSNESALINDRFGLRGIILNNDSPENSKELLLNVAPYITGILVKKNRKESNNFVKWVEDNKFIDKFTKLRINETLLLPFKLEAIKDYINNPKANNYQSLHYVLVLDLYSNRLPGARFELQLRTNYMHQDAECGVASHDIYKNEIPDKIRKVFVVDDFSKINVIGFTGYRNPEEDSDGIHFSKVFVDRRISSTLVR